MLKALGVSGVQPEQAQARTSDHTFVGFNQYALPFEVRNLSLICCFRPLSESVFYLLLVQKDSTFFKMKEE